MSTTASIRTIPFPGAAAAPSDRPKARAVMGRITDRDVEIALLIADGETNKEIAARLGISEQTVKNRAREIYRKFGVNKKNPRVALTLIVRQHGIEAGPASSSSPSPLVVRDRIQRVQ